MTIWTITRRCMSAIAFALPAAAFAFPTGPVEWVVPYAAGGGSDVVARVVASEMTKTLGQTIVINNKPGAESEPVQCDGLSRHVVDSRLIVSLYYADGPIKFPFFSGACSRTSPC